MITYHKDGSLPQNQEIFVFGSNVAGRHGAGAAKIAMQKFGAVYGIGFGKIGNSYAIPTKDENIETLPIQHISDYVGVFIDYAKAHPELNFFITSIGCGLAGYKPEQIAPLFRSCQVNNCSFPDTWKEYLDIDDVQSLKSERNQ